MGNKNRDLSAEAQAAILRYFVENSGKAYRTFDLARELKTTCKAIDDALSGNRWVQYTTLEVQSGYNAYNEPRYRMSPAWQPTRHLLACIIAELQVDLKLAEGGAA